MKSMKYFASAISFSAFIAPSVFAAYFTDKSLAIIVSGYLIVSTIPNGASSYAK